MIVVVGLSFMTGMVVVVNVLGFIAVVVVVGVAVDMIVRVPMNQVSVAVLVAMVVPVLMFVGIL